MESRKGKPLGTETLTPVPPVRADNGGNGVFVNAGLGVEDSAVARSFLITVSDGSLYAERDLGIRNNGRKKERMSMSA